MVHENYWVNELKKESLKEPGMKSKLFWIKPLSVFHGFEDRGFDQRDYYDVAPIDEWDAQVWNLSSSRRGKCIEYYVDYKQCATYVNSHFNIAKFGFVNQKKYCWKAFDNYTNCITKYQDKSPQYWIKGSKLGH